MPASVAEWTEWRRRFVVSRSVSSSGIGEIGPGSNAAAPRPGRWTLQHSEADYSESPVRADLISASVTAEATRVPSADSGRFQKPDLTDHTLADFCYDEPPPMHDPDGS